MKMLTGGILTLLLMVTAVTAQTVTGREYTYARVPSRQALDRLNLTVAWRAHLPLSGRRDGIYSVQFMDRLLLVQTERGVIVCLDAESGRIKWKTSVGRPYRVNQPLAFNKQSVFAIRGDKLFAVNRSTGRMQWQFSMPDGASGGPVADDDGIYIPLGPNKLYAFILPDLKDWERRHRGEEKRSEETPAKKPGLGLYGESSGISLENLAAQRRDVFPEPEVAWTYFYEAGRLLQTPLQTSESLAMATSDGSFVATPKFSRGERYRFKTEASISAPAGQHGDVAYIPSDDFNLYALRISSGKILWRFTGGAEIKIKPEVTDKDVFVVPDRRGLYRVDRATGREKWHNRTAQRFLAANEKFVYAFDRLGRLLVLDYKRGTQLGTLNNRDFVFPIGNEITDRLFLASHNGLLVCLRDHSLKIPLINKKVTETTGQGFKPKEKPKDKDKEKEKKKDDQKKNGKDKDDNNGKG
jgi:outer membrane protein assembly factor BamB